MQLVTQFKQLLTGLNIPSASIDDAWQTLVHRYGEPHRHYHTLMHIESMTRYFDDIKAQLNAPNSVQFAIFYHDIIYDPTCNDNEVNSAMVFTQTFGSYLSQTTLSRVRALTMATYKHELIDPHDTDMGYFLDMDLSILGASPQVYQDYAKAIRQEYHHVSDIDYQQGRKAVLERFLQRPRLYFSEFFYTKFEQQARANLSQEIAELSV